MRGRPRKSKVSTLTMLRERRGLTLREAARAARVSFAYLAKVERGEKPLSNDLLRVLHGLYEEPEFTPMLRVRR